MSKILVAGLVNVEVTCKVDEFPIPYEPIDYNSARFHNALLLM